MVAEAALKAYQRPGYVECQAFQAPETPPPPTAVSRALTQLNSEADNYASDKRYTASGSVARDAATATAFLDAYTRRTLALGHKSRDTKKISGPYEQKGKRKDTR